MAKKKLSQLEQWLAENRKKIAALIEEHNAGGDEVLYYGIARTYPPAILFAIPIIGMFIKMNVKIYLLAATTRNFMIIRLKKFTVEEEGFQSAPMESISECTVEKHMDFSDLRLVLADGKKLVFKDLVHDWADGLKRAIDSAQGKASVVEKEPKTN